MTGIYTIRCKASTKMYLGRAMNISERWGNHRRTLRQGIHKNPHLQAAWNKYGEESFEFEVLEECDERFLCSQEHYWCNILNLTNSNYGYNIAPTDPLGRNKLARSTKQKIGRALKNRVITDTHRKKIGDNNRGKRRTREQIKRQSEAHKGYVFSTERREIQSKNGRKRYKKPFECFDLEGNYIKSFDNVIEAQETLNLPRLSRMNISANLKGRYKKTHGYIFKYKEVTNG